MSRDTENTTDAGEPRPAPEFERQSRPRKLAADVIFGAASSFRLWSLVGHCRRKPILAVFTYHRVTEDDPAVVHLVRYDRGVTRRAFATQVELIKRYFEVLSIGEFLEVLDGRRAIKRHSALITFDDADSAFPEYAAPVLKSFDCPAVVFAPTDYIDSHRRFWHLRVSNAFHNMTASQWPQAQKLAEYFNPAYRQWLDGLDLTDHDRRALACWRFNIALHHLPESEAEIVADRLEAITGPEYTLGIGSMSWTQLESMEKQGFAIESHTASHRKLGNLPPEEVKIELTISREVLERRLNKTVVAVCYPAGSFSDGVCQQASDSGYRAGFITRRGLTRYPIPPELRFRIQRFDVFGNTRRAADHFFGRVLLS